MLSCKKVLCPTDFSEPSYAALDMACELAAHFGAELCVLHVTQPVSPMYGIAAFSGSVTRDWPAPEKAAHQGAERELGQLIERHQFQNVPVTPLVHSGNPADEIVSAAAQEGADLIVIATHGLSGGRNLAFGSVAETVVRQSRCPVLTLHAAPPLDAVPPASMGAAEKDQERLVPS